MARARPEHLGRLTQQHPATVRRGVVHFRTRPVTEHGDLEKRGNDRFNEAWAGLGQSPSKLLREFLCRLGS